jgi:gamma-glutamylcyclotransferase (GGCT)/AIG2-like uncharacterized protein YtfP
LERIRRGLIIFPTFKLMTDLLFVYGTLLQPGNEFADYLNQHCTYITSGKIRGILYDSGQYPGLVIPEGIHNLIHGSIFKLRHPEQNLKVIDDYEGFGPGQEQPNLFVRITKPVETNNDIIEAWVYLYNLSIADLPQITSGNYSEYIKAKKSPGN